MSDGAPDDARQRVGDVGGSTTGASLHDVRRRAYLRLVGSIFAAGSAQSVRGATTQSEAGAPEARDESVGSDSEVTTPPWTDEGHERIARSMDELRAHFDDIEAASEHVGTSGGDRVAGGVVHLAPGVYYPSETVRLPRGVEIRGAYQNHLMSRQSNNVSFCVFNARDVPAGEAVFQFGDPDEPNVGGQSILSGVTIHGQWRDVVGVRCVVTGGIHVLGCTIAHCYGGGFRGEGAFGSQLTNCFVNDCSRRDHDSVAVLAADGTIRGRNSQVWLRDCKITDSKAQANTLLRNELGSSLNMKNVGLKLSHIGTTAPETPAVHHRGTKLQMESVGITGHLDDNVVGLLAERPIQKMRGCEWTGVGIGAKITGGRSDLFTGCSFGANAVAGLVLDGGFPRTITESSFDNNVGDGLVLRTPCKMTMRDCRVDNNRGYGILDDRDGGARSASSFWLDGVTGASDGGFVNRLDGIDRVRLSEISFREEGEYEATGDGTTQEWDVPHGLSVDPWDKARLVVDGVTPYSPAAQELGPITARPVDTDRDYERDALRFRFAAPPAEGDYIWWGWTARLRR